MVHILDTKYFNLKEDKINLIVINSQKFKTTLANNKFINILVYNPDYLQK